MAHNRILDGPPLNIDPTIQPVLSHRSGWAFALQALGPLHDPRGILFDSFVERTFGWVERAERRRGRIPYREPWIGVLHNPPGIPAWHDHANSPQAILARDSFRESLPNCLGLFTLSAYLGRWLEGRVAIPVCSLTHPTEIPAIKFSPDAFRANPRPAVIQVGWWLRRLHSIFQLRSDYRKLMLAVSHAYFDDMLRRERSRCTLTKDELGSVDRIPFLPNYKYDILLSENVVFCDLIDSSANNAIIECIARDTPLLVNRLPAVEEYLGSDYPLFFSTLEEASAKLSRRETILAAHEYLRALPKGRFSQRAFRETFVGSDIYRRLRDPAHISSPPIERCLPADDGGCKSGRELTLGLIRGPRGGVYVGRAEFRAVGSGIERGTRQALQSLLTGLPLAEVRRLTFEDILRRLPRGMEAEAKRAYGELRRAIDML